MTRTVVRLCRRGEVMRAPFNLWRDGMVLDETLEILKTLYGKELNITRIEKIVFGIFFTGVKLSDGSGGVAYTPTADMHSATCCPAMAAERPARLRS
jgi:hypothetical protein